MDDREARRQQDRRRFSEPRRFISLVEQLHRQVQEHRTEAHHEERDGALLERATRRLVWWTAALALVGVCSLVAAFLQWNAIRGQLRVMEEQQRPWLEAIPSADLPLTFDENGRVGISFKVAAKNVGTMPAIELRVAAILLPGTGPLPFTENEYQDKACIAAQGGSDMRANATEITVTGADTTIFPEHSFSVGWQLSQSDKKFIWVQAFPFSPMRALAAEFVGCAVYKTTYLSANWHHTRFAYTLRKARGNGNTWIPIDERIILPGEIRFSESLYGLNRAD